jgi:hypothetical protein
MHFMKSIAITRLFDRRMIDGLVLIPPLVEAGINVVLIDVQQTPWVNGLRQDGLDGNLLDIGQHPNHDFTGALQQTQDRPYLVGQRAAPTFAFQASATAFTA